MVGVDNLKIKTMAEAHGVGKTARLLWLRVRMGAQEQNL